MGLYDDLLDLPRPVSKVHPPMPRADRAKQFMPFAALRGYEDVINQRQEIFTPYLELGEEQRDRLDARIWRLREALSAGSRPTVRIVYFVPRPGQEMEETPMGHYRVLTGAARRIDPERQTLLMDGQAISLPWITELDLPEEMIAEEGDD